MDTQMETGMDNMKTVYPTKNKFCVVVVGGCGGGGGGGGGIKRLLL